MNDVYVVCGGELFHYGVKGMKWGVRHEYIPKGRRHGKSINGQRSVSSKEQDSAEKRGSLKTHKGLTDRQKKLIKIGAIAAGTALVAYGGYQIYKRRDKFIVKESGFSSKTGQPITRTKLKALSDTRAWDPNTHLPTLGRSVSDEETLNDVNPGRIHWINRLKKRQRNYTRIFPELHAMHHDI